MCVDHAGAELQMYECNGQATQYFFARTTGAVTWKTLKTYYSPSRNDHYTTATSFNLVPDYAYVTSPGKVASTAFQPTGAKPLWNWWSPARGDNFLTSDPAWQPGTTHFDYVLVRHEGYVFDQIVTGSPLVGLYTYWSPSREDNFVTRTVGSYAPDYWFVRTEGFVLP
jgi:hypothetical protein